MKIEAFQTLESVLRTGSFAGAAAEMSLTPSAVSMQMKQLEQYLGQPLFERAGPRVSPRVAAFDVAAALRGGLQQLESLRRKPSVAIQGVVKLGIIESLLPSLLPDSLSALRQRHPRLSIEPMRGRSAGLINAVKSGQLDAAVVALPAKGGSERLRWWPLARRELVLIAPPDSTETSPTLLLRRHDWVRYDRNTVTGAMAARHVLSLVPNKRSALELDSAPAIIASVHRGLGVSIIHLLDEAFAAAYPVRELRLGRNAPMLELTLVARKSSDDDRALAVVREQVAALLRATGRDGRNGRQPPA
ncbi:LysR family transcriptional regulator [Xenophilus arseniciresistens]|uniref:LysR family transcriptional regulator n=1 Tax=Xenophilus arseniciresistens TaxID=1283306 RepID=A0AAE3ND09_9BURK|nr:LysR family transcriptional regulator [Xenophilus arseniciresistens]MDA7417359.1 LysR family transcriptional regulator [Xenophilus arseniciresistens]